MEKFLFRTDGSSCVYYDSKSPIDYHPQRYAVGCTTLAVVYEGHQSTEIFGSKIELVWTILLWVEHNAVIIFTPYQWIAVQNVAGVLRDQGALGNGLGRIYPELSSIHFDSISRMALL